MALANRAPSSHNCQPWQLVHLGSEAARASFAAKPGDELIAVAIDRDRAIRALPDLAIEMVLSCGMFLHVALDTMRTNGWAAQCRWLAGRDPSWPSVPGWSERFEPLAVFALRSESPEPRPWLAHVVDRVTNRAPYQPEPISPTAKDALAATVGADPAWAPPLTVRLFEDGPTLERIAAFVTQNAARDFADRAAWIETHSFIRFGDEAEVEDGFSLEQLFGALPGLKKAFLRRVLSPRFLSLPGAGMIHRVMAAGLGDLVHRSPAVIAFVLPNQNPSTAELLSAGARIVELWVRATGAGLALHPVSVVLQHPDIRARFETKLALGGRCVFFARLGAPTARFPQTPRRHAERVWTAI